MHINTITTTNSNTIIAIITISSSINSSMTVPRTYTSPACYTILYYTMLCYTILYYTILYYTIRYYTVLYSTLLYSTLLYPTLLYYTSRRRGHTRVQRARRRGQRLRLPVRDAHPGPRRCYYTTKL